MSDAHDEHGNGRFPWRVLLLVLFPVIYLLSVGPAVWIVTTFDSSGKTFWFDAYYYLYYPVEYLYVVLGEPEWIARYGGWWRNE